MNEPTANSGETMAAIPTEKPLPRSFRPLRIWPAVTLVALMLGSRFGPRLFEEGASKYWMAAVFGPMLCGLLILIWWLAASRATWRERIFGFLGIIAAAAFAVALVHPTMRGPGTNYFTLPMGLILFALAAALLKNSPPVRRTGTAVLLAFGGFAVSTLFRTDGMTGDYQFALRWRWKPTAEESMLAARRMEGAPAAAQSDRAATMTEALTHPEWPGFRGVDRAGHSSAPKIATDWGAHPPAQLWKVPVGPGWSSFAVAGRMLFTQEQRGPKETVVCYDADSGREIWKAEVEARLEDAMGGPGPRATPTLANGALYVTGATGALLRLDAATGRIVWRKELTAIAERKVPMWGFSASPLVTGTLVIVYAGGPGNKGLLALDTASGELRWSVATGSDSYASPQLNTIQGEDLVLMLSNDALLLVDPASGRTRLRYEWKFDNFRALQPRLVDNDTILLTTPMNVGARAIRITKTGGEYAAQELWSSRGINADFADLVTYQGYAYGNDNGMLACLDLKTGARKWKGGRYGKGQLLLLENSGLLLIAAEQGRVALVSASPDAFVEVASFQALEGKTWNHPVLVGDRLYLRNSQEAAAYRLPLEASSHLSDVPF